MDYIKSTDFAVKDVLPTGDPLKKVKGTEIDTEFNNIAEAVATKLNKVASAVTNNLPTFNNIGEIQDSGISSQELILDEDVGVSREDQIPQNKDLYRQVSVTLSSSNVTLTEAQYTARIIRLTGTLSANVSVIFPATARTWEVANDTTGSFTVTIRTPSQSTGLVLKRGATSLVRTSGNNLVFAQIPTDNLDPDERIVTSNVNREIAKSSVGSVGTYAMLVDIRTPPPFGNLVVNPGQTLSGSNLRYAGAPDGVGNFRYEAISSTAPSGTWRCMGYSSVRMQSFGDDMVILRSPTLWLRIS